MALVSGMGARGLSYLPLSGRAPLGHDGARRLAGLLRETPTPLLTSLDLRCRDVTSRCAHIPAVEHTYQFTAVEHTLGWNFW